MFVSFDGLSWLHISFLLYVKYKYHILFLTLTLTRTLAVCVQATQCGVRRASHVY